jgi:hypothetical protein
MNQGMVIVVVDDINDIRDMCDDSTVIMTMMMNYDH